MAAALTNGHEDKHTGMQGCPGFGIAYTTHHKWPEWKTTRSAVIAGRFWRKLFFHFSIFKSLGYREPPPPCRFLLNRPVITALRLVFYSDHFWCVASKKDCLVRPCDNHVPWVLASCWETLAAIFACVEEVWIWLFRNVRGEGFEGSSVVRMARGKTCFRLPFCRQEAVRARQKTVTAYPNSRDLMYRLVPAPESCSGPIWPISVENRRQKSRCTLVYRLVAWSLGGIPISGVGTFVMICTIRRLIGHASTARDAILFLVLSRHLWCYIFFSPLGHQ